MPDLLTPLAQALLNQLPHFNPATMFGRLGVRAWRVGREILLRRADPWVRYELEGQPLQLPLSHDLPLIRHLHPQYMSNVTRLARQITTKYEAVAGIDVGANIGDTIVAAQQGGHLAMLGIEGDVRFFSLLQANCARLSDVEVEQSFVGRETGRVTGGLESRYGTAHFVPALSSGSQLSAKTLDEILYAHPRFKLAHFVKIDTDGFDSLIIESSLNWLAQAQPVIFFEYDPAMFSRYHVEGFKTFEQLRGIGYAHAMFWDNHGDYILACDLENTRLLEDLHQFFSGRNSEHYCDIGVFHAIDTDLWQAARSAELTFFAQFRRTN